MTTKARSLLEVVKESALRRIGRPALIGYAVLLVVTILGVAASLLVGFFARG
jgi:hypothetical protein